MSGLARYDGELKAVRQAPEEELPLLLSLLESSVFSTANERQQAIVCLLSASDGWRDAAQRLSGAFAGEPGGTGLMSDKEE